jgi:hypothetical protein
LGGNICADAVHYNHSVSAGLEEKISGAPDRASYEEGIVDEFIADLLAPTPAKSSKKCDGFHLRYQER